VEAPAAAGAVRPAALLRRALRERFGLSVRVGAEADPVEHGFTHFALTVRVFHCAWQSGALRRGSPPRCWVKLADLEAYPMGKVDRTIARRLLVSK
jgi:hypothetical protein